MLPDVMTNIMPIERMPLIAVCLSTFTKFLGVAKTWFGEITARTVTSRTKARTMP